MIVNELEGARTWQPLSQQRAGSKNTSIHVNDSFKDTLSEFMGDVNTLQKESAESTAAMLRGEPVDIHDVMISANKAKTSFELLMELRNKGLNLYSEVMRIQV